MTNGMCRGSEEWKKCSTSPESKGKGRGIDQRQRNKERCRDGMANGQNTTGAESRGNKPKTMYNERKVQLLQQNQASKLRVKGRS